MPKPKKAKVQVISPVTQSSTLEIET